VVLDGSTQVGRPARILSYSYNGRKEEYANIVERKKEEVATRQAMCP